MVGSRREVGMARGAVPRPRRRAAEARPASSSKAPLVVGAVALVAAGAALGFFVSQGHGGPRGGAGPAGRESSPTPAARAGSSGGEFESLETYSQRRVDQIAAEDMAAIGMQRDRMSIPMWERELKAARAHARSVVGAEYNAVVAVHRKAQALIASGANKSRVLEAERRIAGNAGDAARQGMQPSSEDLDRWFSGILGTGR